MLGHIGLNVPDLGLAKAYYDDLMPLLGYTPFFANDDEVAYRPQNEKPGTYIFFYPSASQAGYSREATGLQHLAFMVETRSAVRTAHQHAVASGATVLHSPRYFPQYPPPYYATFWLDPFGFTVEAVCHRDND